MPGKHYLTNLGVGTLGTLCILGGTAAADEQVHRTAPSLDVAAPEVKAVEVAAAAVPIPTETIVDDGGLSEEPTLSSSFFVDSFYMADWNNPSVPNATSDVAHRAFDFTNGFALAFAGANLNYQVKQVGVTLDLRFGEGANRLIGNPDNPVFSVLKQAYVTWSPSSRLSIDAGQFDTIYGAEVADSWENANYTRGALYYLMQPFYHTGFRTNLSLSDSSSATLMVVNGTNNQVDNNQSPHIGAQYGFSPSDTFGVTAGYYTGAGSSGFGGADATSDKNWEHFFDRVANLKTGSVRWIGNADYYLSGDEGNPSYWGASLAAIAPIAGQWDLSGRMEYLSDPDLFICGAYKDLVTATGTLGFHPSDQIVIRLDSRVERADAAVFARGTDMSKTWFASTLGVAVKTE